MRIDQLRKHATELGFTPMDAVRWLSPGQLLRTGVKVVLSEVFADYADKREMQATFPSEALRVPLDDPDGADGVWLDFVADLGDGFDATYTVAWLLSRGELEVPAPSGRSGDPYRLPRGALLVFGGDQVYPAASSRGYENRTVDPYRAALPEADDPALLVALPGNHDWYDGLTSFLRMFTHYRRLGGWRTRQARSYFVVQLPQRWWLIGLDTQLGTYIDAPQLAYFEEHLSNRLQPGDGVIVCAATPTWVHAAQGEPDAFDTLHWFDRNFIRTRRNPRTQEHEPTGASARLWITGDSHHYVRYAEQLPGDPEPARRHGVPLPPDPRRRQMVTCGLGGAYLSSTHRLPERLVLPPPDSRLRERDDPPPVFRRGPATCPPAAISRRWAGRLAAPWSRFWLPRRNPGFAQLVAVVQVALFALAAFVLGQTAAQTAMHAVRNAGLTSVLVFDGEALGAVVVGLLLPWAFHIGQLRKWSPPSTVVLAAFLQVVVALLALTGAVAVPWPGGWPDLAVLVLCWAGAAAVGAVLGSEAFALFVLAARSGEVAGWQSAGQAIEDVKGFVRMHITPDGALTLYPLLVSKACHDWRLVDGGGGGPGRSRPEPANPIRPVLVEDPIVVAREPAPVTAEQQVR